MLQELHIKNYAIIEAAVMQLHPHLNVIIGETGAGKSILMGALSLVLGGRADTQVLMNKDEKCTVEAYILIKEYDLKSFFDLHDLDYAESTIIRREINPKGKSRAFINDVPVTLDILKSFTSQLIDIHAQHENSQLLEEHFFVHLLDKLSKNPYLKEYQIAFLKYADNLKKLNQYKDELQAFEKEYQFVKYQFEELNQIPLSIEYWTQVEEELNILSNAEAILNGVQQTVEVLTDNEINVESLIVDIQKAIHPIEEFQHQIKEASLELEEIQLKIRSISREFKSILNSIDSDENRLNELNEYQSTVNKLMQKHRLKEMQGLIDLHIDLKEKLEKYSFSEDRLSDLEQAIATSYQEVVGISEKITSIRKKSAETFSQSTTEVLKDLGMPFAKIQIEIKPLSKPDIYGTDKIALMFAPNKGSQLQSLQLVGSGGEKSRLMLAIKSLVAKETALPTLIFDEIDTGISGEVAIKTGDLLNQISKNHQVITITHLPQVAAAGNQHFLVYKSHLEDKSVTSIKSLDESNTILEIAKMLSGDRPTDAAMENAKNLIKGSNS
ncbi:MAG TPA: DNA repair protein RecN [Chitinophagales bacterium]|nr:DNA repair protein RecN [Chitinophagales bacterium]